MLGDAKVGGNSRNKGRQIMAVPGPWETKYDSFLFLSAGINVLISTIPAAIIFSVIVYFDIPSKFWTPILVIYGIGAIGHMLAIGFQSLNIQIKTCADYTVRELKEQFSGN